MLEVLAVAPLPYRLDGRRQFQLGGAFYCLDLVTGLADLGHSVSALASAPQADIVCEPERLPGVEVEWFALDFLSAAQPPPADYVRGQRVIFEEALDRLSATRRPDVVLLGSEGQAWYAAGPCRERGLPTLLVAHGVPTAALPTGIYQADSAAALVGHLGQVTRIVTVARHLEQILRDYGLERVQTITTAVDTEVFHPQAKDPDMLGAYGLGAEDFVVGSFSHLRPEKRMLDLVASAELVVRSRPDAVYLVVGSGPCRARVQQEVAQRGLGASFRFVGEVDHSEVPGLLALSDVVVLASEREGCSLICREAQACGRPLLASDIPAGREVVHGGGGALFRLGDPKHLAARTLELARDAELRRSLGESARARSLASSKRDWIRSFSAALTSAAAERATS